MDILTFIWTLPQSSLGLFLSLYYKPGSYKEEYNGIEFMVSPRMKGGISLGQTIILSPSANRNTVKTHETGHAIQSMILGPLYLLVIGIPSIVHAAFYTKNSKHSYYDFYTEKWANSLGVSYNEWYTKKYKNK